MPNKNITLEMLRTKYTTLRESNASFSLRNYAKQLQIGSGRLSELFNGKRRVTDNMCKKWVSSPFFTEAEKNIMTNELGFSMETESNYSESNSNSQNQTA